MMNLLESHKRSLFEITKIQLGPYSTRWSFTQNLLGKFGAFGIEVPMRVQRNLRSCRFNYFEDRNG